MERKKRMEGKMERNIYDFHFPVWTKWFFRASAGPTGEFSLKARELNDHGAFWAFENWIGEGTVDLLEKKPHPLTLFGDPISIEKLLKQCGFNYRIQREGGLTIHGFRVPTRDVLLSIYYVFCTWNIHYRRAPHYWAKKKRTGKKLHYLLRAI